VRSVPAEKYAPVCPQRVARILGPGRVRLAESVAIFITSTVATISTRESWENSQPRFRRCGAARREFETREVHRRNEKLRIMDQVAEKFHNPHKPYPFSKDRADRIHSNGDFKTAEQSYDSNLERIREGEGLPIESVARAVRHSNPPVRRTSEPSSSTNQSPIPIASGHSVGRVTPRLSRFKRPAAGFSSFFC